MSGRRLRVVLSHQARTEFRDILRHTDRRWGRAQRDGYRKRLDEAFAQIGRFPDLGILRPEIGQGVRTYRVGQHLIVYALSDTEIQILRILHICRDLNAEFAQDEM